MSSQGLRTLRYVFVDGEPASEKKEAVACVCAPRIEPLFIPPRHPIQPVSAPILTF